MLTCEPVGLVHQTDCKMMHSSGICVFSSSVSETMVDLAASLTYGTD